MTANGDTTREESRAITLVEQVAPELFVSPADDDDDDDNDGEDDDMPALEVTGVATDLVRLANAITNVGCITMSFASSCTNVCRQSSQNPAQCHFRRNAVSSAQHGKPTQQNMMLC